MALAIFDLDETLIHGDCSTLWSDRMCALGWADGAAFMQENNRLMAAYSQGELAMEDYMRFSLAPLAGRTVSVVSDAVEQFIDAEIVSRFYLQAKATVKAHQSLGDRLLVISASADHLVRPIARRLGISDVLAIDASTEAGCYTGATQGVLTYREGKVVRLSAWLNTQQVSLENACFYSDSRNDLPLLQKVARPFAVNPDPVLMAHAVAHQWPVLEWTLG